VNFLKASILLVIISLVVGCTNNMVLYKEGIADIEFSSINFPDTASCKAVKFAWDTGHTITLKAGTRWVSKDAGDRFKCNFDDPADCVNALGRVTDLTKEDEKLFYACSNDIDRDRRKLVETQEQDKRKQVAVQKQLQRDVTTKEVLDRLSSIEHNGVKPVNAYLDWNMYSLAESVISSVDVNDFIGLVVLGMKENPYLTAKQENSYVVLQVTNDTVYLSCGDKCGLPVIGIVRVNQRPSPIEKVEYNDTRGVYMFLGTKHYYTQRDRIGSVSSQVQALMFHRITMKDLGLPNDFFEKTHSDLSALH